MDLTMNEREFDDEDQKYIVSHVQPNGNIVWLSDYFVEALETHLDESKIDPEKNEPIDIVELLHKKMLLAPFGLSYYRAIYNGPSPKESHVSVHFVDYGNIEDIPLNKLVLANHVDPDLDTWPTLGFSVFVPEISKVGPEKFLKLFYKEEVTLKKDEFGRFTLFLDRTGSDGQRLNINQFLLNYVNNN